MAAPLDARSVADLVFFRAVVEAGGFARAGDRLGVTQSAVTQRVRRLEDTVGCALLLRGGRDLQLTAAGRDLFAAVRDGFDGIGEAVRRAGRCDGRAILRVSCIPSRASEWLAPRLQGFSDTQPGIDIAVFGDARSSDRRGHPASSPVPSDLEDQAIPAMVLPRFLGPRRDAPGRYGGGSSRSRGATRRRQSVTRAISASIRASGAPTQYWRPPPKPKCWLSGRSGSNRSGCANRAGSRPRPGTGGDQEFVVRQRRAVGEAQRAALAVKGDGRLAEPPPRPQAGELRERGRFGGKLAREDVLGQGGRS